MFSVTFDGNITNEISPYTFVKHGGVERIVLSEKSAFFHDLETGTRSTISSATFDYANWKHLVVNVDHTSGTMKIYEDGNQTATQSFTVEETANKIIGQDWYFGQDLFHLHLGKNAPLKSRSADWIYNLLIKTKFLFPKYLIGSGAPSFFSFKI